MAPTGPPDGVPPRSTRLVTLKQRSGNVPRMTNPMTNLHWQRGGPPGGQPIVLLHGWARDGATDWAATGWVAALAEHGWEAFVCDLPGHGQSGDVPIPEGAEPAGWAAGLAMADLRRFGVGAFAVAGFAEGGLVAGRLAVIWPESVGPLVLIGCDDRVGLPHGDMIAAALRDRSTRVWDAGVADRVAEARADPRHDLGTLAHWVEKAAWPAAARLGALRTPVLIAVGAEDEHRHTAPRLARLFHDARLVTVPGGHRAALAAPELHAQLAAFLSEHPRPLEPGP